MNEGNSQMDELNCKQEETRLKKKSLRKLKPTNKNKLS